MAHYAHKIRCSLYYIVSRRKLFLPSGTHFLRYVDSDFEPIRCGFSCSSMDGFRYVHTTHKKKLFSAI